MTREMKFTIRDKDAGKTLKAFLAARFTYHTEAEWATLAAEGRVTVNGRAGGADAALREGDAIRYDASGIPEPPVDDRVGLVLDDPLMLVVNKSGNLPCHPGGRYFNHTLWALLKARFGVAEPLFVNRLDRETSGLVVVGKTRAAAQNLWRQFASHDVEKRYTVFVEGAFPERLEANGWLAADRNSVIRKKRRFVAAERGGEAPEPDAEWAETVFERVRQRKGFCVVRARPNTGRLHQLRATLLSLGHPVTGDKLYGVDETLFLRFCRDELTAEDRGRLRLPRQALHADYLRFHHPQYRSLIELTVPLPSDMASIVDAIDAV